MNKKVVPIALFAYARPDHLKMTLNSLKQNAVPLIYAFSDGPKSSQKALPVLKVREILRTIDWCDIKIVERDSNLGLGSSIRSGVTKALEKYDRVIVIEDDILMRPGAYDFTVKALEQFEKESKVMTISMWNHPTIVPDNACNGFFSKRFVCWGWGTYRWAWSKYVGTALEIYNQCKAKRIDVLEWGNDIKWQVDNSEEGNFWYVGYALIHFLYDKVSYFPSESLIINIGRDETGSNMKGGVPDDISKLKIPVRYPNSWPKIYVCPGLEKLFCSYFESKKRPFYKRLKNISEIVKRLFS